MTPDEKKAYDARHYRVKRLRGRAADHPCVDCAAAGVSRDAREWSQIHGTDGEDPWTHYVPRCAPCHRTYDQNGHWGPHTEESRLKMSEGHKLAYANGKQPGRWNAGKDRCPQGHPYDEANTYRRPDGGRDCRECMRRRTREARERRKQAS